VLPYFKRAENNADFSSNYHGNSGPLPVSALRTRNPAHRRFLDAARQAHLPIRDDFNGAEQEGLGIYQVTQRDGARWSAARAYIHPHMGQRANLKVETRAQVTRLLFEGKRAVGVEFRQGGQLRQIRARREVVLAAGALQSPQLLMLSGIGDAATLSQHGIACIHHLPGVGRNLQDHPDFIFNYRSGAPWFFGLTWAALPRQIRALGQYWRERSGMMTTNFAECGGFLKTRPDLEIPDIQLHFGMAIVNDHGRQGLGDQGFSCHVGLLRPASRGSVQLRSADPLAAPLIDPNFLGEPADLEGLVEGDKLTRRLMQTPALRALQKNDLVTAQVKTDDDIRSIVRNRADTIYHPVGTCKMGAGDPLAVVDSTLKVHGLQALRIADASIMPTLIGGNTNAPTIMIGEKAADMMREEWG
jgi:choline dehydrogenase-like flavoprotein